jgi:hypothetical protein
VYTPLGNGLIDVTVFLLLLYLITYMAYYSMLGASLNPMVVVQFREEGCLLGQLFIRPLKKPFFNFIRKLAIVSVSKFVMPQSTIPMYDSLRSKYTFLTSFLLFIISIDITPAGFCRLHQLA